MHREPQPEVRVVVEIRAGRNDPVDESSFYERNERRHSQPRRSERAGDREPDRDIGFEHLAGEELASLAKSRGVVGEVRSVDQLGDCFLAIDAARIDALSLEKAAGLVRGVLYSLLLPLFRRELLLRLGSGRRCLAVPRRLEAAALSSLSVALTSFCHLVLPRLPRIVVRPSCPATCTPR